MACVSDLNLHGTHPMCIQQPFQVVHILSLKLEDPHGDKISKIHICPNFDFKN